MKPSSPLLPGTFNSRDVGGLQARGGFIRSGLLVRSDVPLALGDAGRELLRELRIATAVDLREPSERELDHADFDGLALATVSNPILGPDFDLRQEITLEEVYLQILERRGAPLASAVRALARPGALPALVFCSAGKDRTGIVTALVLGTLGVSDDEIVADYMRTEQNMTGAFRARVEARAAAAGISEQEVAVKLGAPPALMWTILGWLRSHCGGAAGYLRSHGMTELELDELRAQLIESRAANAA
ncbi:MAG TPA: tyrosine-protein phosphatase [Solirubrobacteraceae bacterium]|nr:tyrosine-protein phosphatase [Solirubrobacteraceae bacterium]